MLADPARSAAVDRMLPVAIAAREALDRLAAVVMDAPIGIVSLIGAEQQHLVGPVGMGEPFASSRHAPVTPPSDTGHRGRGLEVIGKLAEQLDIRPGQTGTVARLRIGGPPASAAPAAEVSRDQQVEGGG